MNYLLLELYFENTNINCINVLVNKLNSIIENLLDFNSIIDGLNFDILKTPERVVIYIKLEDTITYLKKGVKVADSDKYLQFFLNKINATKDELIIIDDRYYFKQKIDYNIIYDKIITNINHILQQSFLINKNDMLFNLKSLFFINSNLTNENILFNNIMSSDKIIINKHTFNIKTADEYFKLLKDNCIYFDGNKRRKIIENSLIELNANNKKDFIDNVTSISEKPLFLFDKIKFNCDNLFLEILQKVLKNKYILFLKNNYLYFIFLDKNGVEKIENFDNITNSNNYHKIKIEKAIKKANNLIEFNKKVGNRNSREYKFIFNETKLNRLARMAKFISVWIPNSNMCEIDNIINCFIYKNTNLLQTNNELDLLIKKYIMLQNGSEQNFVDTVMDSFKPCCNKKNDVPNIPTAIAISIASKIDNIIYYSVIKELRITVNKQNEKNNYHDLLNIILQNNIDIPLKLFFEFSFKNFINETINKKKNRLLIKKIRLNRTIIVNNILETFYEKLYSHLLNSGNCEHNILNILMNMEFNDIDNNKNKCNLIRTHYKIKNLCRYFENTNKDINYLISSYKRINNLLIDKKYNFIKIKTVIIKPILYNNSEEKQLYKQYILLVKSIKSLKLKNNYDLALDNLFNFSKTVNKFLDTNYINKMSFFKKSRCLKLLYLAKNIFNKIIKFEKLL